MSDKHAVAAQLQGDGRSIYYPEVMSTVFAGKPSVETTLEDIEAALDTLTTTYFTRVDLKTEAATAGEKVDSEITAAHALRAALEAINKELANPQTKEARKAVLRKQKAEKEKAIAASAIPDDTILADKEKYQANLKSFIEANDKYMTAIESVTRAGNDYVAAMTTADRTTTAPLAALIAADRLRAIYLADLGHTYAIDLGVERLAGTRKEHSNFFGTSLGFSGGVVASYRVFQAGTGKLLASDTLSLVKPFAKAKER